MKIVHVLNHFLPNQVAGTEIYVWALCKKLQSVGVDIKICIPNYKNILSDEYIYDGLIVYRYSEPSIVDRNLIMGFRNPDGLKNFISFLKTEKPEIVHFHELAGSNGITLHHVKAAKALGLKTIMTFHLAGYSCKTGSLVYKESELCSGVIDLKKCSTCYIHSRGYKILGSLIVESSKILNNLKVDSTKWSNSLGTAFGVVKIIDRLKFNLNTLSNSIDSIVMISDWYRSILTQNGIDINKIHLIPQGIPYKNQHFLSKRKITSNRLRLMFLGRISKFKGLHLLIEAISDIPEDLVELSIYGVTDDQSFQLMLKEKTVNKSNIYWNGKLDQTDVISTMREHDLLLLCSTFSEMSPLVIQEAFSANLPVIASNVYGNAAQIKNEQNGLLFKFNDVADLKKQIMRCINEPGLIKKMTSIQVSTRTFDDVASDYFNLYKNMLN